MFTSGLKIPIGPSETGLLETGSPVFSFLAECADRGRGFPGFFVLVLRLPRRTVVVLEAIATRTIEAKIAQLQKARATLATPARWAAAIGPKAAGLEPAALWSVYPEKHFRDWLHRFTITPLNRGRQVEEFQAKCFCDVRPEGPW